MDSLVGMAILGVILWWFYRSGKRVAAKATTSADRVPAVAAEFRHTGTSTSSIATTAPMPPLGAAWPAVFFSHWRRHAFRQCHQPFTTTTPPVWMSV